MSNVSNHYCGVNQAGMGQNPNSASLEDKIGSVLDLLNSAEIDVAAVKTQLSEYSRLAITMGVECQPAYEKILRKLAVRLSGLAFEFCTFSPKDTVAPNEKLIVSICEVIEAIRGYHGMKIAIDLITQIIALKRLDVKIQSHLASHNQIIANIQQFNIDTGLRKSVDERTVLHRESISLAREIESLSR